MLTGCEALRAEKKIKTNAQARVSLNPNAVSEKLLGIPSDLPLYFGVSEVIFSDKVTDIDVSPSPHARCERCWNFRSDVGQHTPKDLCLRCSNVLTS